MPTIRKTEFAGQVVWLGCVLAAGDSLRADARNRLDLGFGGTPGERHEGTRRRACSRMTMLYPEGTEVRNVRQLSVLSQEELTEIAAGIGLDELDPTLLGASIVLSGIPDFTHVPPSSRLLGPSGVTLTIDMENRPCVFPGQEIESDNPGHGAAFKDAAESRRGVTAWVERPGELQIGDRLDLYVPDQRGWEPRPE